MTKLAIARELAESTAQLPISWYFDPEMFARERRVLFDQGPGYVGHQLMVPEVGDYRTLDWQHHAKMLVRKNSGVELLSNICRHRQAMMLNGTGNTQNIVCPLHRWTYDLDGTLLGAPHFANTPCLNLGRSALQNWNGLLFEGPRDVAHDLASLKMGADFAFGDYLLDHVEVHQCDYNWKTFIEVYLEDYHVVPFHPGLGNFVNCKELRWEFGHWYSVQSVGIQNRLAKPGTSAYERWHSAVLQYCGDQAPPQGAIWFTYYPNVMIEWYPHVLVISSLHPQSVDSTLNVIEFYYPEDIVLFEREFVEAERAAYLETCAEDHEIARRMQAGRSALYKSGRNEIGPYQSPMEDGMLHFHEFLRRELGEESPPK